MIKLVIFDMDGTLLDSSSAMTHSVNYVRNIMGLGHIDKTYIFLNSLRFVEENKGVLRWQLSPFFLYKASGVSYPKSL